MTYPPLEHCRAKNIALHARVAELEAELSAWEIGEEYQECYDAYESASSGESAALEIVAKLEELLQDIWHLRGGGKIVLPLDGPTVARIKAHLPKNSG